MKIKAAAVLLIMAMFFCSPYVVCADDMDYDAGAGSETEAGDEASGEADLCDGLNCISRGQYLFVTKSQMIAAGYTSSDEFRDAVIDSCKAMEGAKYSVSSGAGGSGQAVDCITYSLIAYSAALNKITNLYVDDNRLVHFSGSCKKTGPWKLYTKNGSTGCTAWLSMHSIGISRDSGGVFKQGAPFGYSVSDLNIKRGEIAFFGGWSKSDKNYRWLHCGIYDGEGNMFWQARSSSVPAGRYKRKEFDNAEQTRYDSILVLHIEDFDLSSDASLLESAPVKYSSYKWVKQSDKWYCKDPEGKKITGMAQIGKKYYIFSDSGVMQTGWILYGGRRFYASSSGAVSTGWVKIKKKWYYFNSYGVMLTGLQKTGGTLYYFDRTGVMVTGWRLIDGSWYYFRSSGAAVINAWFKNGGKWYYFDKDGKMLTGINMILGKSYMMTSGGAMVTGWTLEGDEWYYHKSSGEAACGWYQVGDVRYYFDENGMMLHDCVIDGVELGPDGKIVEVEEEEGEEPKC